LFERQFLSGGRRLSAKDVVHPQFSRELRRSARQAEFDWGRPLSGARDSEPVRRRREQIEKLVQLCTEVAAIWRQQAGKRHPKPEERGDWVRQPQLVTALVERYFGKVWRPEWRQQVEADPNRFAVVRWARFVAWYCLKRGEGQTYKYKNNFDDAHYGLLASYTGHLGTGDKGLQLVSRTIFPDLRIIEFSDLIRVDGAPIQFD
jgi:hypothetical protein